VALPSPEDGEVRGQGLGPTKNGDLIGQSARLGRAKITGWFLTTRSRRSITMKTGSRSAEAVTAKMCRSRGPITPTLRFDDGGL